jgi:AraC family transcriptional regulator, regulatory protein of adaptative response / methylated-DNA-[protein]-cysteine methyltransferase
MQTIHVARLRMPLVDVIHVAANNHGLLRVHLGDDAEGLIDELRTRYPKAEIKHGAGLTIDANRELRRYLEGGPDPDLPVVLPEEGFTSRVWKEIARIPRGETRSYARIAKILRKPLAARAVGQACGRNPLPLVIPCHRVVSADGGIGGFTGGLHIKRRLLALEGVEPKR